MNDHAPTPPPVIWLTGLSGAGKSSIAEATTRLLRDRGLHPIHLDGDGLRAGLCADLGFSPEARMENVRRVAQMARLLAFQGYPVVCSLISPQHAHRERAREILGGLYREVFVRCDLEECIRRDPKGLYARALEGGIPCFTGVDSPYETPLRPHLVLDTQMFGLDECAGLAADCVRMPE